MRGLKFYESTISETTNDSLDQDFETPAGRRTGLGRTCIKHYFVKDTNTRAL